MTKEPLEHDLFETRITLRLPAPLRDALAKGAQVSSRSMNGEIVFRLEQFEFLTEQLVEALALLEKREEALFSDRVALRKITEEREKMAEITADLIGTFNKSKRELVEALRKTQDEVKALKQERESLLAISETSKASLAFMQGMEEMILAVAGADEGRLGRIVDALAARVAKAKADREPTKGKRQLDLDD
ncbi:hypothetical protein X768_04690 [Mesorhizobium sp. LSJC265A00]|uniref:Arc family DNA-binding protein n=1 Tax=Mesorhizobium sp. LSJC265A00 TaxID=1287322 RepID=UPI0003CE58C1|nr:Arc family DNA-binding protein [Mesorhizobium sp. LSJC265A00]ESX13639.1 hypothetical protein X768_04690 [Mesorhizobium sp. LSJC265A00]